MDYEVQATEEFAARLDEAIAYRVNNYGLRSARKLIDSYVAIYRADSTAQILMLLTLLYATSNWRRRVLS